MPNAALRLLACCALALAVVRPASADDNAAKPVAEPTPAKIDYARQIRTLLSDKCFKCHGPDAGQRQAGLRFDLRESALAPGESGSPAIRPGSVEQSSMIERICASDPDFRMPPPNSHKSLTPAEIELIKRWIRQGAEYSVHWAFVPPKRPATPIVESAVWARNAVDYFVLEKLRAAGLDPAPEAERTTLIRRLSLDLTGLPPSAEEVERFVLDNRPQAYRELVDRMMASPHYGEKMAQEWLDLARFGDTNGYQDDAYRPMWLYRDWVISAFNHHKPFDEFTIEQLAGDLLPGATLEQRIATGFNRNHRYNEEGGADPDEFQVAYAMDRTNTTATVWLGLTFGCAQCHDHKYDPISQREYYQLYAFFNSLKGEVAVSKEISPPFIRLPTSEQQEQLATLDRRIASIEKENAAAKLAARATPPQAAAAGSAGTPADPGKQQPSALEKLKIQRAEVEAAVTKTLVMEETAEPRPAHVLTRGNFDQPGDRVERNVPAIFPPLPADAPRSRLALARWLVSGEHPLTARVTVNRLWKQFFGQGLVRTVEDFGAQGEFPSHAALLDWLACELVDEGWSIQSLQKTIVMSATYRQSSVVRATATARDPYNRLCARGARFRLSAEEIRDSALAVSGLLSRGVGGPSVHPHQPTSYYADKSDDWKWNDSAGGDRLRRGIYTFWRRTTPYPSFTSFDAPSRELCTALRPRTNTPLQALVTLNDPVFVEAACAFARTVMSEGGPGVDERINYAVRRCLARRPTPQEQAVLRETHRRRLAEYQRRPEQAEKLVAAFGGSSIAPAGGSSLPQAGAVELAAWTSVASVLLNLDETITRE